MKTWLTKFRISNALNDRQPLPPTVRRAVAQSEELRRFAGTVAELDGALKNSRIEPETSASLHAGIMSAVRSSEPAPAFDWRNVRSRLIPVAVLAMLALLGISLVSQFARKPAMDSQTAGSSALADASSALDMGGELVRDMPDAALSPLNDEMLRLNCNLVDAQEFLLASLP